MFQNEDVAKDKGYRAAKAEKLAGTTPEFAKKVGAATQKREQERLDTWTRNNVGLD